MPKMGLIKKSLETKSIVRADDILVDTIYHGDYDSSGI